MPIIPVTAPLDDPTELPRPRYQWLRRVVVLCVGVALFVAISRAWWVHREQARLDAEIDRWRQAGFTLFEPLPGGPPLADEQNAALAINLAARELNLSTEWTTADSQNLFQRHPWSAATIRLASAAMADNRRALEGARAARGLPGARWQPRTSAEASDWSAQVSDPHKIDWTAARRLAITAAFAADEALHRRDEAAYFDHMLDVQFIARTVAKDPLYSSFMIGTGLDATASTLLCQAAHELELRTEESRQRARQVIAGCLDDALFAAMAPRAMTSEARLQLERLRAARPPPTWRNLDRYRLSDVGAPERAIWTTLLPCRLQNARECLQLMRDNVAAAAEANYPAVSARMSTGPNRLTSNVEPVDSALRVASVPCENHGSFALTRFHRQLIGRFAAVSLACRLYALDHSGRPPNVLDDLLPQYLSAVPLDPFDPLQRPLRYLPTGGGPFIYSVGAGGVDAVKGNPLRPLPIQHLLRHGTGNILCFLNPNASGASTLPATSAAPQLPRGAR